MNNLKKLLKELEDKREKLSIHKTFVLYYDTAELEFVKKWKERKSVYKKEELQIVDGLLQRLKLLNTEANSLLSEIETFQKKAAAPSTEPRASSINDFIGKIENVTSRILIVSAECDVIVNKLPDELALGTT